MNPVIGIIGGNGRLGRLFSDFFRERGIEVLVSDVKTKPGNTDIASKSDIVIVSVPIDKTINIIESILPHIRKSSAIMDFTSVKEKPVNAMLKGKCEVLGMHPMFGNSNPIPGQTMILCPTRKSGKWSKWMEKFLLENRVRIQKMSALEHDKIMNISQGLIHFAEITFADSIRRCKMSPDDIFKYCGKASEMKVQLAARLIDQDAGLYGSIQIENPQALKSLKEFKNSVDELIKIVEKKDLTSFKTYFSRNKKFLGGYTTRAYNESSYLIDKLIDFQNGGSPEVKMARPTKNSLVVLGPKNTFSDIAASKYLEQSRQKLDKYFATSIDELFEIVASGKVKEGIVPIENKLHGTVRETLDGLFSRNVHIVGEINIPIHHSLIAFAQAKKSDIKKIISHSQALNQCKKFLKKNFPKAVLESFPSTATALQEMLGSYAHFVATIAPQIAANDSRLKIFANNIEDEMGNSTTFIVIRKGKSVEQKNSSKLGAKSGVNPKTSIAFYFNVDSPGSLFTVFKDFADAKINMTKIESRPTKARFGDYIFYLDFEGHSSDPNIKKTLAKVEKKVAKLKVLGSY